MSQNSKSNLKAQVKDWFMKKLPVKKNQMKMTNMTNKTRKVSSRNGTATSSRVDKVLSYSLNNLLTKLI